MKTYLKKSEFPLNSSVSSVPMVFRLLMKNSFKKNVRCDKLNKSLCPVAHIISILPVKLK